MEKSADAFRTISEVAADLALPQHVLRFWEQRFPQIRPLKRAGGRRYYRPPDVLLLRAIRRLLYDEGYTIKGVQRLLKEQGARALRADDPGVAILDDSDFGPASPAMDGLAVEPVELVETAAADASLGAGLRDILACIEDCVGILATVRRPRP